MLGLWSLRQSTLFNTSQFLCRCSGSRPCGILWFLIPIGRRATISTLCFEGIWQIFKDSLPTDMYTGHSFLPPANSERSVPSAMKIQGTSVYRTLGVDVTLISTLLSSSISPYLCLPPPACSVHLGLEVFLWRITVKATLRGVNELLGVGRLLHQLSHAFDDVWTPVLDRALVIVIPSHFLESV